MAALRSLVAFAALASAGRSVVRPRASAMRRIAVNSVESPSQVGQEISQMGSAPPCPRIRQEDVVFDNEFTQFVDEEATLKKSTFPIPPNELLARAKTFFHEQRLTDAEYLSDDFRFVGPVVGPLNKEAFLKAITGFEVSNAFPDINGRYYHFRVDPFEPNRVWCTTRNTGTNTGTFGGTIKATGKTFYSPPEAISVKFDETGKVTQLNVGAVMDRTEGNTGGLGGIFGMLYGIGKPLPFPEAQPFRMTKRYRFFNFMGRLAQKFAKKKE